MEELYLRWHTKLWIRFVFHQIFEKFHSTEKKSVSESTKKQIDVRAKKQSVCAAFTARANDWISLSTVAAALACWVWTQFTRSSSKRYGDGLHVCMFLAVYRTVFAFVCVRSCVCVWMWACAFETTVSDSVATESASLPPTKATATTTTTTPARKLNLLLVHTEIIHTKCDISSHSIYSWCIFNGEIYVRQRI